MTFKEGDKVICVREYYPNLKNGAIYTIYTVNVLIGYGLVTLEEDIKLDWYADRFVLATPLTEALA